MMNVFLIYLFQPNILWKKKLTLIACARCFRKLDTKSAIIQF